MRNPLSASPLQIWAIEDTSIQLTWGSLPPGQITAWAHDAHTVIDHAGGPGSINLSGLKPDTDHRVDVTYNGGRARLGCRTLARPAGVALAKVATINDVHLGSTNWGASKLMKDRSGLDVPFAMRCAKAAVSEAIEWGAELLIIKGDAAHHQKAEHYALVGELVDSFDELPVLLIPGNHDVDEHTDDPVPAKVGERGIPYVRGAASEDLPGIRVIVADTSVSGQGTGSIDRVRDDVIELASVSPSPFLLGLHHQLQARRIPTHYPIGIGWPSSVAFLDELAQAKPQGLVTSGHTHRNRARGHGSLMVTEVASTRDWPGVWAGYAIHEGGIRQVIRRAEAADAISWHEYSRRALLGIWERWSIGPMGQRCFTHDWS